MKIDVKKGIAVLQNKKQSYEISKLPLSINEKDYEVDFILSTVDVDRHHDVVDQKTWDLKPFLQNPVLLEQHKSDEFPFGKFVKLWYEDDPVNAGEKMLVGRVKFAVDEYDRAKIAFNLVKAGFMSAVSVGFIPKTVTYDEDLDGFILSDCELMEVSLCSVPANARALVKAYGFDIETFETSTDVARKGLIEAKKTIEEDTKEEDTEPTAEEKQAAKNKHTLAVINKAIRLINKR